MARILIVDDDITIITLIRALLEQSGHEVFGITNPSDIEHFLERHEVDAVLCDLIMPDMSGWEVYEFLRRRPDTMELPVLFVSGTTDISQKVRAFAPGFVTSSTNLSNHQNSWHDSISCSTQPGLIKTSMVIFRRFLLKSLPKASNKT